MSLSFGANNNALSTGTMAIGFDNISGVKGYYFWDINFDTKVITLSLNQRKSTLLTSKQKPTKLEWEVGDVISIVNDAKYGFCSKITAVDTSNMTITVDKLPFTSIAYDTASRLAALPYDFGVIVPEKPEIGEVDLGFGAFAYGYGNKVAGMFSAAFGVNNIVGGDMAFVTGGENKVSFGGIVSGRKNTAIGEGVLISGNLNTVNGYNSVAMGNSNTVASGYSQAFGVKNNIKGKGAAVFGEGNQVDGNHSFVSGYNNNAGHGNYTHVEGHDNTIDGDVSRGATIHIEGYNHLVTETTNAHGAHIEGAYNSIVSNGWTSHVEGLHNTANAHYQHVQGKYNKPDASMAHIVGWGTESTPANIHTLDTKGNAWFKGNVTANNLILTDEGEFGRAVRIITFNNGIVRPFLDIKGTFTLDDENNTHYSEITGGVNISYDYTSNLSNANSTLKINYCNNNLLLSSELIDQGQGYNNPKPIPREIKIKAKNAIALIVGDSKENPIRISNVNAPIEDADAVNKAYVDNKIKTSSTTIYWETF